MATFEEIEPAGVVELMEVWSPDAPMTSDGPSPFWHMPGTLGSSGAVDHKTKVGKQRAVVNNTSPNGSVERPVRARNTPHGDPSGAHALSLNESTGVKTKGPKRHPHNKPELIAKQRVKTPTAAMVAKELPNDAARSSAGQTTRAHSTSR